MDSDDELLITKLTEPVDIEPVADADDIVKLEVVDEDEELGNNFQVFMLNFLMP